MTDYYSVKGHWRKIKVRNTYKRTWIRAYLKYKDSKKDKKVE